MPGLFEDRTDRLEAEFGLAGHVRRDPVFRRNAQLAGGHQQACARWDEQTVIVAAERLADGRTD
jgi:hypothetical protein